MPLVGLIGGVRVESWLLPQKKWDELKRTYRAVGLVMSCGRDGVPVTRSETRYFRHKPDAGCQLHEGGPESPEHLRAKAVVADTARELGWVVTVEYPAPDRAWIADVMIEKDGRRIAIEIQWSRQSNMDFRRRQDRYEAAGVGCLWLIGAVNNQNVAGVPHHRLEGTVDDLRLLLRTKVSGDNEGLPLSIGFGHVLRGDFQDRMQAIGTSIEVTTAMAKCWRAECNKWMTYW